jgi:serine/threonine protein kinase
MDKNLIKDFKNNIPLQMALFDILVKETQKWYINTQNSDPVIQPKCFVQSKDDIVSNNDWFQELIDNDLVRDPDGRLSKTELLDLIRESDISKRFFKATEISNLVLNKKDLFDYKKNLRHDSKKGCYVGIRLKTDDEIENIDYVDTYTPTPVDTTIVNNLTTENIALKREIEKLKALLIPKVTKYDQLKLDNPTWFIETQPKQKIKKPKQKTKKPKKTNNNLNIFEPHVNESLFELEWSL